jgi:deoxyadenosine/deoxycytidine kinase
MASQANGRAVPLIGVVGPCAAGKTTLVANLTRLGIRSKHIAQEHSYVPDMWKRLTDPDILVYLDVSYVTSMARRRLSWTEAEFEEQILRLENARSHADLIVTTDLLTPQQVLDRVLELIKRE